MRSILVTLVLTTLALPAVAQHRGSVYHHYHHHYPSYGGGIAPFVGGAIVGGIIGGALLAPPPVVVAPRPPVCYERWTGYYDQYGRKLFQTYCN